MSDNHDNKTNSGDQEYNPSRRRFVKNTGMVIGGIAGGSVLGGLLTNQLSDQDTKEKPEEEVKNEPVTEARMFFTRYEDFVVLEQATERIYPEDKNGPGAIELRVPYFIDKQLAGSWGVNAKDYRQTPFDKSDADAVNARMTRGDLFLNGLRKMNQKSQKKFDTSFDEAEEEQQIDILKDFEANKVKMNGVSSASFFELLRITVLEGAYADPLYGGNENMEGWKMKEFPGPVSSYANIIEDDDFVQMDPISLTNYQRKS